MSFKITYSPAYTIVPTYECFNRCSYCNFRQDPGESQWLSLSEAKEKLESLANQGICEILILSGEVHPHSSRREAWLQRIYNLCQLALSLGFLPHSNVGPLKEEEMAKMREVNVSLGLMLEQLTPKLTKTVHLHAPSKEPRLRLEQLELAGKLKIPFTTGMLLGIGETPEDWQETLEAIALMQQRYGHIQEVILQPHSPGQQQSFAAPAFAPYQLPEVIATARAILPPSITIQIPPNLIDEPSFLNKCLEAGARDLGGIGPRDEVNPSYPHPTPQCLAKNIESKGWQLVPRLPIYPQYDDWLSPQLREVVQSWRLSTIKNSKFIIGAGSAKSMLSPEI